MEFNFADEYAIDGQTFSSELIRTRSQIFTKLRKDLTEDETKVVDLIKYYYELGTKECPEWVISEIIAVDDTYSRVHGKREAKLFAKCLIKAAMADQSWSALLGIQTANYSLNSDADQVDVQYPELAEHELIKIALESRNELFFSDQPADTSIGPKTTAITAIVGGDNSKLGDLLKTIVQDTINLQKNLGYKLEKSNEKIASIQQENEMLWWYVGGWSKSLEVPLNSLEHGLIALIVGSDLATLTNDIPAPAAVKALIHKTLVANGVDLKFELSIKELVNSHAKELNDHVLPEESCYTMALCPIISGFSRYKEIPETDSWINTYKTSFGFDPEIKLKPLEIAFQIYRELLLLKHIG